jgi:hypothetical protein
MLALAFLALAACPPETIRPLPDARAPRLEPGSYDLVVEGVFTAACAGVAPRELVGARVPAELSLSRHEAALSFPGWVLRGDIAGTNLFVEGHAELPPVAEPVGEPEEGDVGEDDAPVSSPDEGAPDEPDCVDASGRGGADCGDERPVEPPSGYASFDAQILDSKQARGELVLAMDGCELALDARLVRVEGRPDVPVYEEAVPGEEGSGESEPGAGGGSSDPDEGGEGEEPGAGPS